ncbi:hypothetical protein DPMN_110517 [Dreissena polymorpha]|uniref:Uncharacterized protein n=1 Tax=Dreissena polymorpha TaxID=45954 RepID=A0A9D4KCR0_DREPO|nr:hypothetical protein DPMN_110517 [Dreissena polymorpha]
MKVTLSTKRIGQFSGRETILGCEIKGSTHDIGYWMEGDEEIDLTRMENKYKASVRVIECLQNKSCCPDLHILVKIH